MKVMFEDEWIIVLVKPSKLAVQSKKGQDVQSIYPNYYVVHRLDQRVSGLLVLAKNKEIAAKLSDDFQTKKVIKSYLAVVKEKPILEVDVLEHWLGKTSNKAVVSVFEMKDYKKASLKIEILRSSERYHLLQIQLFSGRFHQIRAQLAFIGSPIVGDLKYGYSRSSPDGSIFLHAFRLEFNHPINKVKLLFEMDQPEIWSTFGL